MSKEKILDLAYKYANDNIEFHTQNTVSLKQDIIERELKELIEEIYFLLKGLNFL